MSGPTPTGRRVALLFGGRSPEHEVSVRSARNIQRALRDGGETVIPIGLTRDGRWLAPESSARVLDGDASAVEAVPSAAEVFPDPAGRGLWEQEASGRKALPVDAVFPIVHGVGGEDGKLQSVLELAGLPYAGPGPLASAICMDKGAAKDVLRAHDLPVTPGTVLQGEELRAPATEAWSRQVTKGLRFPLFVKPANGGSSVGIRKVTSLEELPAAVKHAAEFDDQVLVEQGIEGQEIECALIGNDQVECAALGEIVPPDGFYDYESKYENDSAELIVPAQLDDRTADRVREDAVHAYRALRLEGFARIDFLVERGSSRYYINEANTLPGFTEISMFPRLWAATGLNPSSLVKTLVDLGVERFERRERLITMNRS